MPRITKAMLEKEIEDTRHYNRQLFRETQILEEKIKFLKTQGESHHIHMVLEEHARSVDALSHAVTALVNFINRR